MKRFLLSGAMIPLVILTNAQMSRAEFFSDGFESGDLSHTGIDGSHWSQSPVNVSIVAGQGRTGVYAARFRFEGKPSGQDSTAELRFDFGEPQTDVYIQYYIKFPSNYVHRADSPNNNKMIRLWTDTYSDDGQIGASAHSGDLSRLFAEAQQWGCGPIGQGELTTTWQLTTADLDRWLSFEWRFKPDTGGGNGAIQFWVDGDLKFSYTNLNVCDAAYLQHGYLLGWANSGFSEQTDIYIDDVVFSDSFIEPGATPPGAPSNLSIVE